MHRRKTRLKGLLVVFASVLLALGICGLFYYFKIKQNENYQNQLHFRALHDINTSFNNGIDQLLNYRKQYTVRNERILKINREIEAFVRETNKAFKAKFEKQRQILSAETQVRAQQVKFERFKSETSQLERKIAELENEIEILKKSYFKVLSELLEQIYLTQEYFEQKGGTEQEYRDFCFEEESDCDWYYKVNDAIDILFELNVENGELNQTIEENINKIKLYIKRTPLELEIENTKSNIQVYENVLKLMVRANVTQDHEQLRKACSIFEELANDDLNDQTKDVVKSANHYCIKIISATLKEIKEKNIEESKNELASPKVILNEIEKSTRKS